MLNCYLFSIITSQNNHANLKNISTVQNTANKHRWPTHE